MKKFDSVNAPKHYTSGRVSPIELIASCGMGDAFARGNAIKYIARAEMKSGTEDLRKALWYVAYALGLRGVTFQSMEETTESASRTAYQDRKD